MTASTPAPTARVLIGLAVLVCVIVGLHQAARLGLRGPDGFGRDALSQWVDDPVTVAATITRWLALGFAYYLLAVVALVHLGGGRTRIAGVPVVPSGAAHLVGMILGVSAVGVPLAHHVASTPPQTAAAVESPLTLTDAGASGQPRLDPVPTLTTVPDDEVDHGASHPFGMSTGSVGAGVRPDELTVETGDHLWSISAERLVEAWQRTDLADAEIVPYWKAVIEANRDRLVDRDNPDLILPGQVLLLPDPPPDPKP